MNKRILSALNGLGVPVAFQHYSGEKETYITFFSYSESDEDHADDKPLTTSHMIQVDIWSKSDYTDLVKRVEEKMQGAGFKKINYADLYENRTKIFHKAMRFKMKEEKTWHK